MKRSFRVLLMLVLAMVLSSAYANAQQRARDEDGPRVGVHRSLLANAGVSPDDAGALMQEMRTNEHHLAASAALVLSRLPQTEETMRALREAGKSSDEGLAVYAFNALARLGNTAWVPDAQALLRRMDNPELGLQLAGRLAQAGYYDGWPLIERALTSRDRRKNGAPEHASAQAPLFLGMKDKQGNPVNLAEELKKLMAQAPSENKKWIVQAIDSVTAKRPRPWRPQPK